MIIVVTMFYIIVIKLLLFFDKTYFISIYLIYLQLSFNYQSFITLLNNIL